MSLVTDRITCPASAGSATAVETKIKLDLTIANLNHLRQSRIAIWIKQERLRKAQYLSRFRTIMSVERYRNADMEDLKEQSLCHIGGSKLHHPFK